jgi:hypothetical protein
VALCGIAGTGVFVLLHHGYNLTQGHSQRTILPSLSVLQIFWLAGVALVVTGIALIALMQMGGMLDRSRERRELAAQGAGGSLSRGRVPGRLGSDDDEDDLDGSSWEDDGPDGEWDDTGEEYADSRYGPSYDESRYAPRADASRRGGRGRQAQWDDGAEDEDDDSWRRDRGGRGGRGGRGNWR